MSALLSCKQARPHVGDLDGFLQSCCWAGRHKLKTPRCPLLFLIWFSRDSKSVKLSLFSRIWQLWFGSFCLFFNVSFGDRHSKFPTMIFCWWHVFRMLSIFKQHVLEHRGKEKHHRRMNPLAGDRDLPTPITYTKHIWTSEATFREQFASWMEERPTNHKNLQGVCDKGNTSNCYGKEQVTQQLWGDRLTT